MPAQFDDTSLFGIDSGDQKCGLSGCPPALFLRIVLENWIILPPAGHYRANGEMVPARQHRLHIKKNIHNHPHCSIGTAGADSP